MRLISNCVMILALMAWGIGCDSPPANSNGSEGGNSESTSPVPPELNEPGGTQSGERQPDEGGLNSSPENQLTPGNADPALSFPQSDASSSGNP